MDFNPLTDTEVRIVTWFKVSDTWYDDPVGEELSDAAMALWTRAGSWCSKHLTDGRISRRKAMKLCDDPERGIADLTKFGVWTSDDGDETYLFVDWFPDQPSREAVLAERAAGARRQALFRNSELKGFIRGRDQDTCRYCGKRVDWTDRRSAGGGTYDHVDPHGDNGADNIVVSCRGCNSGKGQRTPEQARMTLLPPPVQNTHQDVTSYAPKTDLGSPSSPTRPDPTRPDLEVQSQELFPPPPPAAGDAPTRRKLPDSHRFDEFWAAYPHKRDKDAARRAWAKVVRSSQNRDTDVHLDEVIAGAGFYRHSREFVGGMPKYPATFLNAGSWRDYAAGPPAPPGTDLVRTGGAPPPARGFDAKLDRFGALAAQLRDQEGSTP